ncbi:MAG: winged helix-turn-helix transcriptional regulator [Dehalococcoidales bacterium]|nr:winged helix-turn-helix transcriptional regulator [Dehalococcoidales bacterium]
MIEILQSKSSASRFQILVEVAASGPNVLQRSIARKLGITPQAVSEYFRQLQEDGMLIVTDRSGYRVSAGGVNWVLKQLRELNEYISIAARAVTNITVCAAVAESDLSEGQTVGLRMKDGLLFATPNTETGARGIAVSAAKQGDDVDITNIEGLIDNPRGSVTILQVPGIDKGGSKQADLKELQFYVEQFNRAQIGAIGIEALIALRRLGIDPQYFYGVAEAAIEASHCGLPFLIVCSADAMPGLSKRMQDESVAYQVIDISLSR